MSEEFFKPSDFEVLVPHKFMPWAERLSRREAKIMSEIANAKLKKEMSRVFGSDDFKPNKGFEWESTNEIAMRHHMAWLANTKLHKLINGSFDE